MYRKRHERIKRLVTCRRSSAEQNDAENIGAAFIGGKSPGQDKQKEAALKDSLLSPKKRFISYPSFVD
jgi:hypothetical protein